MDTIPVNYDRYLTILTDQLEQIQDRMSQVTPGTAEDNELLDQQQQLRNEIAYCKAMKERQASCG